MGAPLWVAVSAVGFIGSLAASVASSGADGLWLFSAGWLPAILLGALELREAMRQAAMGDADG